MTSSSGGFCLEGLSVSHITGVGEIERTGETLVLCLVSAPSQRELHGSACRPSWPSGGRCGMRRRRSRAGTHGRCTAPPTAARWEPAALSAAWTRDGWQPTGAPPSQPEHRSTTVQHRPTQPGHPSMKMHTRTGQLSLAIPAWRCTQTQANSA